MKRKTSGLPSRVFKFGCKPPTKNAELIRKQLYAATVYYNRCIEMEKQRRDEYRAARSQYWPELMKLEDHDAEIRTALKEAVEKKDEEKQKSLKAERKQYSKRLRELRQEANAATKAADEELAKRKGECASHVAKKRRAEAVAAMLKEKQWSDWWKAKICAEQEHIARQNEAHCLATGYKGRQPVNHHGDEIEPIVAGTCDACRKAAEAAWKAYDKIVKGEIKVKPKKRAKIIDRGRPAFARYDGGGTLRVQLTPANHSLSKDDETFAVNGQWLQVWVTTKPRQHPVDAAHPAPTPGSKRQQRLAEEPGYGMMRLRIGSTGSGGRDPVWAELPVRLHRRIAHDVALKWGSLVVKREGIRLRYELQITAEHAGLGRLPAGEGVAAVNFGWRSLGDGSYRLAMVVDDQGNTSELVLPASVPNPRPGYVGDHSIAKRLAYVDGLQQASDVHFNAVREELMAWLAANPDKVSKKLKDATEYFEKWRDPSKLVRATMVFLEERGATEARWIWWKEWRAQRLAAKPKLDLFATRSEAADWMLARGVTDADQQLSFYLHLWLMKQLHLYQWATRQRANAIGHRRQIVQCWAKSLAYRYSSILIEDYDLRELEGACSKSEEEEDQATKRARKNRTRCAPGEARDILRRVAGSKCVEQDTDSEKGRGASQRCTACGATSLVDPARIKVTCPDCGATEDQDERNCRNRLREHFEGSGAAGDAGSSRSSKERAEKAQRAAVADDPSTES